MPDVSVGLFGAKPLKIMIGVLHRVDSAWTPREVFDS